MSLCVIAGGCAFDRSPLTGTAASPTVAGEADNAGGAGAPSPSDAFGLGGASGAAAAGEPAPPPAQAGTGGAPATPSDASTDASTAPNPSTDAGTPPAERPLPDDAGPPGEPAPDAAGPPPGAGLLDPCTQDDACADGLTCYAEVTGTGFCAEPCDADADCSAIDGFDYACSTNEHGCRIECSDEDGAGTCPSGFACQYERCLPADAPGSDPADLFEPCEHTGDCAGELVCYRWADSALDGPGYCTLPCEPGEDDDGACELPASGGFDFSCGSEGGCRFDCTDDPCPPFMQCEKVDGEGGRCRHPY